MKLFATAAAVLTLGLVFVSNEAAAQCSALGSSQWCENRSSGNMIDKRGSGGNYVACPATSANKVQFDFYVPAGGGYTYICTTVQNCSALNPSSPEHQQFC